MQTWRQWRRECVVSVTVYKLCCLRRLAFSKIDPLCALETPLRLRPPRVGMRTCRRTAMMHPMTDCRRPICTQCRLVVCRAVGEPSLRFTCRRLLSPPTALHTRQISTRLYPCRCRLHHLHRLLRLYPRRHRHRRHRPSLGPLSPFSHRPTRNKLQDLGSRSCASRQS